MTPLISHDIVVTAGQCRRILVLERGRIVEELVAGELLTAPQHPHTQALVTRYADAAAD